MATKTRSLDVRAFGLACGLLWAGAVALLGVTARFGWGRRWQRLLADVYRGYDESSSGLVVGALWAFVDGLSGGVAFAWLYDRLARSTTPS
ncbi:MAG: bacteriophage holin [Haloplanus sp.]